MKKFKTKVDEIFGEPIYFNKGLELFTAEIDGHEYQDKRLGDLKDAITKHWKPKVNIDVIYAPGSSEMKLTQIKYVSEDGGLTPGDYKGYGIPDYIEDVKDVFPRTKKNISIYLKSNKLRDEGWELIRQSERMNKEMEPFPKNYWLQLVKEKPLQNSGEFTPKK